MNCTKAGLTIRRENHARTLESRAAETTPEAVGFGCLLRTPEPTLVEVLGYAGYDYVVLDAEHGAHSLAAHGMLMLTAFASTITPIVRVNKNTPGLIMRVLDIGAQGVFVPHIENADDARRAVAAVDRLMSVALARVSPSAYRCAMPSRRARAWPVWAVWKRCCIRH